MYASPLDSTHVTNGCLARESRELRPGQVSLCHLASLSAALLSAACAHLTASQPSRESTAPHSFDDRGQAALQRGHNLGQLHPTVRGLLAAPDLEHTFIEHGVVELPLASCASAVLPFSDCGSCSPWPAPVFFALPAFLHTAAGCWDGLEGLT